MFSEPPRGLDSDLVNVAANATRWSSIKGVGVIAAEQGRVYDVDPSSYFPIWDSRRKEIEGHMIARPYFEGPFELGKQPNMMEITLCTDEEKKSLIYKYSGQQLNELTSEENSPVCGIYTFGKGFSDYVDVIPILRELMVRITLFSRVLNKHSNPHLEGPVDLLAPEAPGYDPQGMYLPLGDLDTPQYRYVTWDAAMSAANSQIGRLLIQTHPTPVSYTHLTLPTKRIV